MAIENQNYDPAAKYGGEWVADDIKAGAVTGIKIAATSVEGSQIATGIGYFSKSVNMPPNTTEQTVFGTSGLGVAASITGFFAISMDTTAVTVTLSAGTSSVGTIVLAGRDETGFTAAPDETLENAALAAGTNLFLTNSAEGEVQVTLTFEID